MGRTGPVVGTDRRWQGSALTGAESILLHVIAKRNRSVSLLRGVLQCLSSPAPAQGHDADDDRGEQAGADDELAERAGQAGGIHGGECALRVRQSSAGRLSRVLACD